MNSFQKFLTAKNGGHYMTCPELGIVLVEQPKWDRYYKPYENGEWHDLGNSYSKGTIA
jgi:hypothetical protein